MSTVFLASCAGFTFGAIPGFLWAVYVVKKVKNDY